MQCFFFGLGSCSDWDFFFFFFFRVCLFLVSYVLGGLRHAQAGLTLVAYPVELAIFLAGSFLSTELSMYVLQSFVGLLAPLFLHSYVLSRLYAGGVSSCCDICSSMRLGIVTYNGVFELHYCFR